jgi:hypothetical protein
MYCLYFSYIFYCNAYALSSIAHICSILLYICCLSLYILFYSLVDEEAAQEQSASTTDPNNPAAATDANADAALAKNKRSMFKRKTRLYYESQVFRLFLFISLFIKYCY